MRAPCPAPATRRIGRDLLPVVGGVGGSCAPVTWPLWLALAPHETCCNHKTSAKKAEKAGSWPAPAVPRAASPGSLLRRRRPAYVGHVGVVPSAHRHAGGDPGSRPPARTGS